jgi:hypothetical protein
MNFDQLRQRYVDSCRSSQGLIFWGVIGVILIMSFYNLLFCFRFLPLTEGWFLAYANLLLKDMVPYKDFYLHMTPVYPMIISFVVSLFGESLIVLRIFGLFVVVGLSVTLYGILVQRFRVSSAMLVSVTACVYYQSGVAHIQYDFTQILTLFTLISILFLMISASNILQNKTVSFLSFNSMYLSMAGFFAMLAFLTKQSNGAFVFAAAWLSCLYFSILVGSSGWKLLFIFTMGGMIPLCSILVWLQVHGALPFFWKQIFDDALSAKGSIGTVLFAWFFRQVFTLDFTRHVLRIFKWLILFGLVAFGISKTFSFLKIRIVAKRERDYLFLIVFTLICGLVICISFLRPEVFPSILVAIGIKTIDEIIPLSIVVSSVLVLGGFLGFFVPWLKNKLDTQYVVLGTMTAGMIWGNGTSAGLSEISAFVMLAFVLCVLLEIRFFQSVGLVTILTLSCSIIFIYSSQKFLSPYSWWAFSEPTVKVAKHKPKADIARGLKTSQQTAETIDALMSVLNKVSPIGGDIFAFPHIPIVYLMTNRWPHSKVLVSWFDFLPDSLAKDEALRLKFNPPETIVNVKLPSYVWNDHEELFRGGNPLGQRDIEEVIRELTEKQKRYNLELSREVSPGVLLEVWQKW